MQDALDVRVWQEIANEDVSTLVEKDKEYGGSWKRRGGVGAFMMAARKHDRLEEIWKRIELRSGAEGWDIFEAIENDHRDESILDDIRDLRRYLILIEGELLNRFRGSSRK